ncbi:MAG: hypothetical protein R3B70_13180 [Polyangiaceae bacterium]
MNGECVRELLLTDTILENSIPGDCQVEAYCDDEGHLLTEVPHEKDTDDANDCTLDACQGAIAGHQKKRNGTPCDRGAGVCEDGQCTPGTCDTNGKLAFPETDIDCGAACPAQCKQGATCRVHADCTTGFCSAGECLSPFAVAITSKPGQTQNITTLLASQPSSDPITWTVETGGTEAGTFNFAGAAFDTSGEAVAIVRQGNGGRASRWSGGSWGPVSLWSVATSANWIPVFAVTDPVTHLFAQNLNLEHLFVDAATMPGGFLQNVTGASGQWSGAAAVRDGHAAFYYAPGTDRLVETRYLVNGPEAVWTPPQDLLLGNYSDASPAAAAIEEGTLIVAARRTGDDHVLDWALILNSGARLTGQDIGPKFLSPKAVTRRYSLAARKGPKGGAVLAFRNADGKLEVWLFEKAPESDDYLWRNLFEEASIVPDTISQDPVVAPGLPGAQAEALWIRSSPAGLIHSRLTTDADGKDKWTNVPTPVITGGGIGSVGLATP